MHRPIQRWDPKAALMMPHCKWFIMMKVPEEKPASPPGSCRMIWTFVLGTSRSEGMLLHEESSDLLVSLQAWPPSHNSTAGSIRNLFIPSMVPLRLLWSNVLGPWDILVNTDSWPPGPWLLTGSRGLRKTESGACGFRSGEDKFTCNSITLWSVVCQKKNMENISSGWFCGAHGIGSHGRPQREMRQHGPVNHLDSLSSNGPPPFWMSSSLPYSQEKELCELAALCQSPAPRQQEFLSASQTALPFIATHLEQGPVETCFRFQWTEGGREPLAEHLVRSVLDHPLHSMNDTSLGEKPFAQGGN